jgi:aspartyl aminopeptidase
LAGRLDVEPADLLAWELSLRDLAPPAVGGDEDAFVFSARIDNQFCCYAALEAFVAASPSRATHVLVLLDHEEVGSQSWRGAQGPFLRDALARIERAHAERASGGFERALAGSWMASADMAHAVHPNYADRHEPGHRPRLNGGPVVKTNAALRYATDLESGARFRSAAAEVGVSVQEYVHRTDLPCGTTIGPLVASELGIRVVDVGCAMLSMHSIREQCGARDVGDFAAVLRRGLEG